MKAIGLFSGGLDSILAVKLMTEQGLDVEVVQYRLGFESLHIERLVKHRTPEVVLSDIERQLGVPIQCLDVRQEFLPLVFAPRHGYGSGMNPCVDCKIFILKKAKAYMETHDAQFVFTGEVIGQRPMSQYRQTLLQTEKLAGLQGYLLRPLSAQLLDPTIPEQQGWVDREKLLAISGRSRTIQMELAQHYHLAYPQPSGGCLLTDPKFSERFRELLAFKPKDQITVEDIELLKLGRHFRLADTLKLIVGRHAIDNTFLQQHTAGKWVAEVQGYQGPLAIIDGEPTELQWEQIAQIVVSYTKGRQAQQVTLAMRRAPEYRTVSITPDPMQVQTQWRIV